jgi:argininosuccinate lyase
LTRYRELTGIGGGGPVYSYASSISHDVEIAWHAVFIMLVHVLQLAKRNLIPAWAACKTVRVLLKALDTPSLVIREGFEDVFEVLEQLLEEEAGRASHYVWLGRSRNDHVSAALRLYTAQKILDTIGWLLRARRRLVGLGEKYREVYAPLHTHQQPSQLASISCLFACWEEALATATSALASTLRYVLRSPLGAAAGAGTMAPLDVEELASSAGFREPIGSTVYASGSRLDVTLSAAVAAAVLTEISRIASDIIMLSTPYTGILRLPDRHVATSSIMPHKRNPATMEVARARGARAAGLIASLLSVQAGLPYGYNLDLQEANPALYTLLRDLHDTAAVLADLLEGLEVDTGRASELASERVEAVSAELAEEKALRTGVPHREAYVEAAAAAREGRLAQLMAELGFQSPIEVAKARRVPCSPQPHQMLLRVRDDEEAYRRVRGELDFKISRSIEEAYRLLKGC